MPASDLGTLELADAAATFRNYRKLAEGALAQLDDRQFHATIDAESNSVALIVKHVGGNLRSRWSDFLTSDGEKPDRARDDEFVDDPALGRAALMMRWEQGWTTLFDTLSSLRPEDLVATVRIRGEEMTALAAINRSLAHTASHVGQIIFLAKHLRSVAWQTLSIPRAKPRDPSGPASTRA